MPLFCSNFKPATDHLLSRSLIYEYKKSIRGPEQHVKWLMQNKEILQLLMISYMQNYYLVDRKLFVWDLDRMRSYLKSSVKAELAKMDSDAVLQDRQISQFASLLTVYHWLKADYRRAVSKMEREIREQEQSKDDTYKSLIEESLQDEVNDLMDQRLFGFVRKEIVRNAVIAARHDPLSDYIDSIGTLIQAQKITTVHFNWLANGKLNFWAKAVWDIYENEKRGTDSLVRKDIVDEKLKELSELSKTGDLKVVNWAVSESSSGIAMAYTRQRGYSIPNAVEIEIFRNAFNWDKFRPAGSLSWDAYKKQHGIAEEDDDLPKENLNPNNDESAPF